MLSLADVESWVLPILHHLEAEDFFCDVSLIQAMSRSGLAGPSMENHMDMSHLQMPKLMSVPPQDEPSDLEELEQFAKAFKQRRIKLGFTQVNKRRKPTMFSFKNVFSQSASYVFFTWHFSIFMFLPLLFCLVWNGQGSVVKRWCHELQHTNQDLVTFAWKLYDLWGCWVTLTALTIKHDQTTPTAMTHYLTFLVLSFK